MTGLLLLVLAQPIQQVRVQGLDGGPVVNVACVSGCSGSPGSSGQPSIAIDGGMVYVQNYPGTQLAISGTISAGQPSIALDGGAQLYAASDATGTTWRPLQFDDSATDGIATQTEGLLDTDAHLRLFNGTTFDRGRSGSLGADGVASTTTGALTAGSYLFGYNGTTWDRLRTDTTAGLWTQLKAAIPAGSAIIGKVGIDQTTPGTTNAVSATLAAGSAVAGKFGIDQTTPGTTNGVSVTNTSLTVAQSTAANLNATAVLAAGSALVGKVGIDQTTVGTTNAVSVAQLGTGTINTSVGTPGTGTLRVFPAQSATYSASTSIKTATAAGTAPFFSICGSGTKTIRVHHVTFDCTVATAAVFTDAKLTKTSAATSGGTCTALTKVPHDSSSAAATAAIVEFCTVLATAGTAVGPVCQQQGFSPITGTPAAYNKPTLDCDFAAENQAEGVVLRGTAQCLEGAFATTTTNAPTCAVRVQWSEE